MRREKRLVTTQRPPGSLFKGLESTDFVYLYILLSYIQMVDAVATGRLCPSSFSSQFSGGVWSVGAGCREASTFAFTVSSASRQQTLKGGSSHWSANEVELKLVVFFPSFFFPLWLDKPKHYLAPGLGTVETLQKIMPRWLYHILNAFSNSECWHRNIRNWYWSASTSKFLRSIYIMLSYIAL